MPAIRLRMLASLANVSAELVAAVAAGLGVAVPKALPLALTKPTKPEVKSSPRLSLMALPGNGGVRTRKVAILVADGVVGGSIGILCATLKAAGAVPSVIAPRLGTVQTVDGAPLDADGSLENSPSVLFDALVLADGSGGVMLLGQHDQAMEFINHQYRHGKTILAIGPSKALLDKVGIGIKLPSGLADPGILRADAAGLAKAAAAFMAAVGKHRHPRG